MIKRRIVTIAKIYGGNRWVFSPLLKTGSEEQERKLSDSEFHMVGAAKAKERLPSAVRTSGIVSRLELEERRLRVG
jgi:hypothetical protein